MEVATEGCFNGCSAFEDCANKQSSTLFSPQTIRMDRFIVKTLDSLIDKLYCLFR